MIFKTRKQFEEEVYKRLNEIDFRNETERKITDLQCRVNELEFRIRCIEDKDKCNVAVNPIPTYEPAPYWTNPGWKAPEVTCTAPCQTTCTTSEEEK